MRSTRVVRDADCDTDHKLVESKLALTIRKKIRKDMHVTATKRINCSALKTSSVNLELKHSLEGIEFDNTWDTFKEQVYNISSEKLGFIKRKNKDWFVENNSHISDTLNSKRELCQHLLNTNTSSPEY